MNLRLVLEATELMTLCKVRKFLIIIIYRLLPNIFNQYKL